MIPLLIFGISLFGIVFMLGVWALEVRMGRRLFLPERLARKDDAVRMFVGRCNRRVTFFFTQCVQTGAYLFVSGAGHLRARFHSKN